MSVSSSASVASMGLPMFMPLSVFSAIDRVVLLPSVKTGALFSGCSLIGSGVSMTGCSSISVILIVMFADAVPPLPSVAVIVAV